MDLSIKQRKLLRLLSLNCRFKNRDIAKAIGSSADTVQYQTDKLITHMQLGKFVAVFDCRLIGYQYYHLFFRMHDAGKDISALSNLKFVSFVMSCIGRYDYQVIILAKDKTDLADKLKKVRSIIGKLHDEGVLEFQYEYAWTHLIPELELAVSTPKNQKNPLYRMNSPHIAVSQGHRIQKLDETDKRIIRELLVNPRESYLKIGQKAELSHETVRKRMREYSETDFLIGFSVYPDYKKFGLFTNLMLIKVKEYDDAEFTRFLRGKKYVFYAARLLGEYNLIIYTYDKNPDEFSKHSKEIRSYFHNKIETLELLFFQSTDKYVQFPEELL